MRKATIAAAALLPVQSLAASSIEDFDLRTAEDLVDLCGVPDGDAMMEAARGFWYGFLSGVGSYHRAISAGKGALIGAGVGALGGYIYDQDLKSKGY